MKKNLRKLLGVTLIAWPFVLIGSVAITTMPWEMLAFVATVLAIATSAALGVFLLEHE